MIVVIGDAVPDRMRSGRSTARMGNPTSAVRRSFYVRGGPANPGWGRWPLELGRWPFTGQRRPQFRWRRSVGRWPTVGLLGHSGLRKSTTRFAGGNEDRFYTTGFAGPQWGPLAHSGLRLHTTRFAGPNGVR